MNTELVYHLTCKYGSEYRTGVKTPDALVRAQIKMLLNSGYCWEVGGDWWGKNCSGIDCAIPYISGGEFSWRLQSNDSIVSAIKTLYQEVYSEEALRVEKLRDERSRGWYSIEVWKKKNRILNMQRVKRGEISCMPVYRRS